MQPVRYAVGMDLALPDPEAPAFDGYHRDGMLIGVAEQVALVDDYTLFTPINAEMYTDFPLDFEGDALAMAGLGVGNILTGERAKPVLDEAERLGRTGELPGVMAPVLIGPALGAVRSLILPPHSITQMCAVDAKHPLHGVALVPAVDVKKLLQGLTVLDAAAHLMTLIEYCIRTRVVLSVVVPRP